MLLLTDKAMVRHDPGPGHPERPERLGAVLSWLDARGIPVTPPRPVPREALLRVHTQAYVDAIEATDGQFVQLDPDTATSPGSVQAARLAAGAAVHAVDAVMDGIASTAYAAVESYLGRTV